MEKERIYLDHNATSPLRPKVARLWRELSAEGLGNPSSLHASGRRARAVIDDARVRMAAALGVHEEELVFTSGGTESNNLALLGSPGSRAILATPIEHPSVLEPVAELARRGRQVKPLAVGPTGRINPDQVAFMMETTPVDLMTIGIANNEIGTVQPVEDLKPYLDSAERRPRLHIDAVQALGRIPLNFQGALRHVDLASFSMHKVGGPLGVGVLFVRRGVELAPLAFGGGHEEGMRPGTESAAAIASAALAVELAVGSMEAEALRMRTLTRAIWEAIGGEERGLQLLGPPMLNETERLPNTLSFLATGRDARMLVTRLDREGVELSAGSACSSGAVERSHVLDALGVLESDARSGLRISIGWNTTGSDCKRAVDALGKVFFVGARNLRQARRLVNNSE